MADDVFDFGVGGRALCVDGNGLAFPLVIVSPFGGTGSAFENRDRPCPASSCHVSPISDLSVKQRYEPLPPTSIDEGRRHFLKFGR